MSTKVNQVRTTTKVTVKHDPEKEKKLKGTFASVLLLGGFIVLSWAGVFFLFISRL